MCVGPCFFNRLIYRCVGVVGGIWCCMGWAVRVGYKAVEVATGGDKSEIVSAETSGVSTKRKWGGGELRSRVTRQGSGWVVEGGSPYGSYANTPVNPSFITPSTPLSGAGLYSPLPPGTPNSGTNGFGLGLGLNSPMSGHAGFPSSPFASQQSFPASPLPGSPATFPPSPMPPHTAGLNSPSFAAQQTQNMPPPPPPRRENSLKVSGMSAKKSD